MDLCRSFYITKNQYPHIFPQLLELCHIGKNLYNQMLYYWKNWYDVYEESLSFFDFCWMFKRIESPHDHYRKMQSIMGTKTSDYSLQMYNGVIQSYFKGRKEFAKNPKKFRQKPRSPNFYKGYYYHFATGQVKCSDEGLLEFSPRKNPDLKIQIPKDQWFQEMRKSVKRGNTFSEIIKQVRFYYKKKNSIKVELIYEKECEELVECNENVIGIDLGIDNFATLVSNQFSPIILNGKVLKSVNQWYNRSSSKYKPTLKKCSVHKNKKTGNYLYGDRSHYLDSLKTKRNEKVKSIMHKYSTYIIELCKTHRISSVIVGKNHGWKQKINIGKVNTQKFVQIPFNTFTEMLSYKCKLNGIHYFEVEESYTSKTDNMALEHLFSHVHKKNQKPKNYKFIGKRVKRGLFQSSIGKLINADVNGAIGILRKKYGDDIVKNIKNPFNPKRVDIKSLDKSSSQFPLGIGNSGQNPCPIQFSG